MITEGSRGFTFLGCTVIIGQPTWFVKPLLADDQTHPKESRRKTQGAETVDLHRKRQVEIFGQIARHLVALVYFVAELVLGEKAPKLGSS